MRDKHLHIAADSQLLKAINSAVRQELHRDSAAARRLMIFKFCCYFTLLVVCYAGIFRAAEPVLVLGAYIFYGLTAVLLGFNFAHDCSHHTVFRSSALNHGSFVLLYTLLGAHAEGWKHRHVSAHHYAPNVQDYDTDLQITSLIRVAPGSPRRWFHRFQHWYAPLAYTTYSLYWVFVKDFVVYAQDARVGKPVRYHLSFWMQKVAYIGYLLVLPLMGARAGMGVVLIGFLGMHVVQSGFLLFTFFITHHVEATAYFGTNAEGLIETSWINNQLKSSNDFYPFSPLANFIFGGFNNHIAHHLFPHIHHIYYPALSRILYRVLAAQGVRPNMTGYWSGVRAHLRHLKKMGLSDR